MVKRITIVLNEDEFEKWKMIKGKKSWYEFFKELIELKDKAESVPSETIRSHLAKLCSDLAALATSCDCPKEEVLLRLCAGDVDVENALRALLITTHIIESLTDEYKATMIRALKAAIVNVVKGDVEGARELLKGVCPP